MSTSAITVENLVKSYKNAEQKAVDSISFNVEEGEFFSLLGPNGAGKTTTISILTTTLSKTSGRVNLAGLDLDTQASQIRQKIGIIFQNPSLDLNLTAEENIRFHAILYGVYPFRPAFRLMPKEYQDKVHELGTILGIDQDMFKALRTFSGGMKRKLEIIRSLIHNPKILFLDEPTSGLDPVSRNSLWRYLADIQKNQGTTIFLTTHYLEEAENSDHICIINHGKIVSFGTPTDIKQQLTESYLEIDATNKDELREELNRLGFVHTQLEQGNLRIDLQKHNAQEVIQKIQTVLTTLKTYNPTVEEAYLKIIEKTEHQREEHV
ncbi:ABC transporter ATP-binding protein [candidate division WWE3 bacterium]|nr:ABC transporter ATP-binding protein [candidate division WWE3 bacterium]